MNILLFTTTYLNLYSAIVDELREQGHYVCVIEDKILSGDPKLKRNLYQRFKYKNDLNSWDERVRDFWSIHKEKIDNDYELFICLNGVSINDEIIRVIKDKNTRLKDLILYAWDDLSFWNFNLIKTSFTRTFTFDLLDSRQYPDWRLLPPFFVKPKARIEDTKYNLFMIGTNHDRRFLFINKIIKQLNRLNIDNNYIKLLKAKLGTNFQLIKSIFRFLSSSYRLNNDFNLGKMPNYTLESPIGIAEYNAIMQQSKFVLDDVRPGQSGLAPRFIWALANNKKIVTTNQYAEQYTFVSEDSVVIINRNNPKLTKSFFVDQNSLTDDNFYSLEISNWVRILIAEKPVPIYDRSMHDK